MSALPNLRAAEVSGPPLRSPADSHFLILHDFPPLEVATGWRGFLGRVESPSHYSAPEYFLEPYWEGKNPFAVLAWSGDKIVGVLTGLHIKGQVTCGLPSRPQICIDKGVDATETTRTLAEGLLREAGRARLITVYTWDWTPLPGFEQQGFRILKAESNVVLDLSLGIEELSKQSNENRRRNIRIATRNGIQVSQAATAEDVADYWEVYSQWRKTERKKIVHNHTLAMIQKVHEMRGNHRRFLARYKGKLVAATGLRFYPGGLIEYANNCSLDEYMNLRPNDLLIRKTMEWACEQGFSKYSLGGAHPFLRKSGGTVVPIYRYRMDRTFLRHHDLAEGIGAVARALRRRLSGENLQRQSGHPPLIFGINSKA
jgi:Acetyltransferase (GNAT) domain